MLTGFSTLRSKSITKPEQNPKEHFKRLKILMDSIDTVLKENSYRVYIEESPYIVEFKLPDYLNLNILKEAIERNTMKSSDSVFKGEIWVHTFSMLGRMEPIEVLYKPYSVPKL